MSFDSERLMRDGASARRQERRVAERDRAAAAPALALSATGGALSGDLSAAGGGGGAAGGPSSPAPAGLGAAGAAGARGAARGAPVNFADAAAVAPVGGVAAHTAAINAATAGRAAGGRLAVAPPSPGAGVSAGTVKRARDALEGAVKRALVPVILGLGGLAGAAPRDALVIPPFRPDAKRAALSTRAGLRSSGGAPDSARSAFPVSARGPLAAPAPSAPPAPRGPARAPAAAAPTLKPTVDTASRRRTWRIGALAPKDRGLVPYAAAYVRRPLGVACMNVVTNVSFPPPKRGERHAPKGARRCEPMRLRLFII